MLVGNMHIQLFHVIESEAVGPSLPAEITSLSVLCQELHGQTGPHASLGLQAPLKRPDHFQQALRGVKAI